MTRLIVKVVINGIILIPLLKWYTEATTMSAVVTSIIFSIIAYLIGDRLILRATNNLVATISDAVLAAVYLWAVSAMMNWSLSWGELLFTVVLLGVAEMLYHYFLKRFDRDTETA